MRKFRFGLSSILTLVMVAMPAVALADLYINGTGDLRPWDKNQCNYYGQGFRCSISWGNSTGVTFNNSKKQNGCALRVYNKGSMFKGDRWHVEIFKIGWAQENCTYHWVNDNTVDISEP